ncbi:heterokaryon incompatibility protein-domain-containing protein [Xylaria cf. heliscus]|nr:heterokaryon incompatibility protein-domain-containing protein [Xylaria cf. heliscus]
MSPTFLCIRCIQLPLQDLFWTSSYDRSVGIVTKGHSDIYLNGIKCFTSLNDVFKEEGCVFCALLRNILSNFYTSEFIQNLASLENDTGLYLYQEPLDLCLDRYTKVEGIIPLSLNVMLSRQNLQSLGAFPNTLRLPTSDPTFSPQLIAMRMDATNAVDPCLEFGREVETDKIDWSIVQGWINSCLKHTTDDLTSGHDTTSELHLLAVDVIDGYIVKLPPGVQYIALSYVWGDDQRVKLRTRNLVQFLSKGYLQSELGRPSKTIVDSMKVVRLLGYRYLWVDALCIVQDDPTNLQQNVMEMDRVYSRALFTIVAAAGADANHGLPGLSSKTLRTQKQQCATINGVRIANRLQSDINGTLWNTRGWTYQERVLSKRLLFFSEVQVEYSCEGGCDFQEQFHNAYDRASFTFPDTISYLDLAGTNLLAVYANAVTEYTKRSMGNPTDKLKAFQGILGRLKEPFQAPFLFGVPISLFDIGLLWYPIGSLIRTKYGFPSWSWAGWNGPVHWGGDGDKELVNLCESTVSICTIRHSESSICLCADAYPDTDEVLSSSWERHYDDETSEIYYISTAQSNKGYRYPRPLHSLSHTIYSGIADTTSIALEIQGKIATLRLTGQHAAKMDANCKQGIHKRCKLAVLNDKNRVAGTITTDGKLIPQLQGHTHKFLALSRSTYIRAGLGEETGVGETGVEEIAAEYIEPTWDREKKVFRPWDIHSTNSQEGQGGHRVFEEYERPLENWIAKPSSDLDDSMGSLPIPTDAEKQRRSQQYFSRGEPDWEMNNDVFDKREFSDRIPWPRVNVLLLSQEKDGYVERIGCGQIHVDAFMPNAQASTVMLR